VNRIIGKVGGGGGGIDLVDSTHEMLYFCDQHSSFCKVVFLAVFSSYFSKGFFVNLIQSIVAQKH